MFDLDMSPTPLQIECERLRQEVGTGKQMLGRMMAEYAALRDENERMREALDTVARVSNDPAIAACAKRALRPNVEFSGTPAALSPEAPLERRVGHGGSDGE